MTETTEPAPFEDTRPPTVLVVDDEHEFRKLLVRILELEGFNVVAASDAIEALDLLEKSTQSRSKRIDVDEEKRATKAAKAEQEEDGLSDFSSSPHRSLPDDSPSHEEHPQRIDIALLDVALPGMNGMTLFSRMQQDERLRKIPVIFLTGDLKYESKERAFEAGAVDYITKPFQKKELIVRLKAHIRDNRQREREKLDAAGLTSQAELSLEEAQQRFAAVVRNSFLLISEFDSSLNITYLSPNHPEVLALHPELMIGQRWTERLHPSEKENFIALLQDLFASGADKRTLIQFNDGTGHWRWLDVCANRFFTREGEPHLLLVARDITHTKETERYLQHLAQHDTLTGLANRQRFTDELERIIHTYPAGAPHAVVYADVDNFKLINDRHGHFIGDQVLRDVGIFLKRTFGEDALVISRFGGDEFCAILNAETIDDAQRLGDRICKAIARNPILSSGERHRITLSMGIAQVDADLGTKEVLTRANSALHVAKSHGKNRCCTYRTESSELMQIRDSAEWFLKLQEALDDSHRFVVHYQPIVELTTGRISHCEALIRYLDEDGQLRSPAAFLPAAERYGLMRQIDRHIVRHVFADMVAHPELHTSINLSGGSVTDPTMAAYILQCFDESGIDPSRIVFEITETVFMTNLVQAREMVERLQRLGCIFGLDDFGSGFSSLNYLRHLPVNLVKIDGSFIREVESDPVSLALLKSINEIAHLLGKQTVAEWVESAETCRVLRQLGLDFGQGYYHGKPAPLETLLLRLGKIAPIGCEALSNHPAEDVISSRDGTSRSFPE